MFRNTDKRAEFNTHSMVSNGTEKVSVENERRGRKVRN